MDQVDYIIEKFGPKSSEYIKDQLLQVIWKNWGSHYSSKDELINEIEIVIKE